MKDLTDAALKGHGVGLIREILGRFGKVQGPRGEVIYSFDRARTDRFFWKLIRGLYYLHLDIVLPAETVREIVLVDPKEPKEDLDLIGWFPAVRDTESLAVYGRVFDYKWTGWKDGELRGHAVSMLFWDGLIVAALFHDPRCRCATCASSARKP